MEMFSIGLNHAAPGMAGVYSKHDYLEEMRLALDNWAAHLIGIRKSGSCLFSTWLSAKFADRKAGSGGPKADIRRRHDNFSKAAIQCAKR